LGIHPDKYTLQHHSLSGQRTTPPSAERPQTVAIESISAGKTCGKQMAVLITLLDIEENGVRLRLTVVDTPGFGDFVNNHDRYAWFGSMV